MNAVLVTETSKVPFMKTKKITCEINRTADHGMQTSSMPKCLDTALLHFSSCFLGFVRPLINSVSVSVREFNIQLIQIIFKLHSGLA